MSEQVPRICAPSEDSDQPAHSRSLIRIFIRRILGSKHAKFLHAVNEDWSDCADAQSDQSLRWAHKSEGTYSHGSAHIKRPDTFRKQLPARTQL